MGAFHEMLLGLALRDWGKFCQAATISLLVFADTIFTSILIEGELAKYKYRMKLLDLLNFVILSLALVVLDLKGAFLYEIDVQPLLADLALVAFRESLFWILLAVYILLLLFWNSIIRLGKCSLDGVYQRSDQSKLDWQWRWQQPSLAIGMCVMAILSASQVAAPIKMGMRVTMVASSLLYLTWYKRNLVCQLHPELH